MKRYNAKIGGGGFHHVAMRVRNFEVSVKFYKDAVIAGKPPCKVRIAFCKGPDGEVIEFFQSRDERRSGL